MVSMVVSPAARLRNLLLCLFRSPSSVVQDWPDAGTNCRSSVQIGHIFGGASEGWYCVPQAVQIKAGMRVAYTVRLRASRCQRFCSSKVCSLLREAACAASPHQAPARQRFAKTS